jgi:hypothetical protein
VRITPSGEKKKKNKEYLPLRGGVTLRGGIIRRIPPRGENKPLREKRRKRTLRG